MTRLSSVYTVSNNTILIHDQDGEIINNLRKRQNGFILYDSFMFKEILSTVTKSRSAMAWGLVCGSSDCQSLVTPPLLCPGPGYPYLPSGFFFFFALLLTLPYSPQRR
jgi:hypothetical protein